MTVTSGELKALYEQAKYKELIELVENRGGILEMRFEEDAEILLQQAWAYHQLGEYDKSINLFKSLVGFWTPPSPIGESVYRGLAHGYLQREGDLERADKILGHLSPGRNQDNVRMNTFIVAARKGLEIFPGEVMGIITNSLARPPYETIDGHIINNGVLVFHEAREQANVKPYLPILPGLIQIAIDIYRFTTAAKNHIAGALYRASQVLEAAGKLGEAEMSVLKSIDLWRELVAVQGGERYKKNLEGAEAQLEKVESRIDG